METLKQILSNRGLTKEESELMISKAKKAILDGSDPYEIVNIYFGLGPSYVFDLV